MNQLYLFISTVLLLIFSGNTLGQNSEESPWYFEGQLTNYRTSNSGEDTFLAGDLLIQYTGKNDAGVYFSTYYDEYFRNYFIGGTKAFDDYEFGLGIGESNYDDEDWLTFNTWFYKETDRFNIEINLEYTPEELSSYRMFYKTDAELWLTETIYLGVYGERWVGIGPKLGFALTEAIEAELITIIFDRGTSSLLLRLKLTI